MDHSLEHKRSFEYQRELVYPMDRDEFERIHEIAYASVPWDREAFVTQNHGVDCIEALRDALSLSSVIRAVWHRKRRELIGIARLSESDRSGMPHTQELHLFWKGGSPFERFDRFVLACEAVDRMICVARELLAAKQIITNIPLEHDRVISLFMSEGGFQSLGQYSDGSTMLRKILG